MKGRKDSMKKRTKKLLAVIGIPAVILCAGIFTVNGGFLPVNQGTSPDMKYSAGVKVNGMTAGYVPVGIGTRGDANGDGTLTAADAAFIASYLAHKSVNPNYMPDFEESLGGAMADADNNGGLSARDSASIAKFLAVKSIKPNVTWEGVLGN